MAWKRRSKYGAVAVYINGIRFASKREAARYCELLLMLKAGKISDLTLQPVFKFPCGIKYKADFAYTENGKQVNEDVKGFEPATFRLKMKMFKHHFPNVELRILK
jgi:hypothetical protein